MVVYRVLSPLRVGCCARFAPWSCGAAARSWPSPMGFPPFGRCDAQCQHYRIFHRHPSTAFLVLEAAHTTGFSCTQIVLQPADSWKVDVLVRHIYPGILSSSHTWSTVSMFWDLALCNKSSLAPRMGYHVGEFPLHIFARVWVVIPNERAPWASQALYLTP